MPRRWDGSTLAELTEGALVVALDAQARPLGWPEGLDRAATATVQDTNWTDWLATVHRADRAAVVRGWTESVNNPGERIDCQARTREEGQWRLQELTYINLLDEAPTNAVLLVVRDIGPGRDEPEDLDLEDTIGAPTWSISFLDRVGRVIDGDGNITELFDMTPDELRGAQVMDVVVHPDDQDAALVMWLEVLAERGATRTFQHRIRRRGGDERWLESTVMNRLDADGGGAIVAVSHDITERRRELTALQESQEELRLLAEQVPAAVFRADRRGTIGFANDRWYELVGHPPPVRLHDLVHLDDLDEFERAWARLFHPAGPTSETLELRTSDGARTLSVSCRAVGVGEERSAVIGAMEDVTATTELRYRADHDPLTGLLNRRAFDRRLARALEGPGPEVVVFFVDLDGFKGVNDTHGHAVGDEVLGAVAERLRRAVRPGDILARYGGDEFLVLCTGLTSDADSTVTARLTQVLADPIGFDGGSWSPAASIGVARSVPGDDADTLLKRADEAMYDIKRSR